ncbi:MAG: ABC transporter permease, partial [Paracoccaceae bacterium]
MGLFILRRLGVMIITALCLTFIVFILTNLSPNLEKLAKTQGNARMSDEAVESWLGNRGYLDPMPIKFGRWLGVVPGWTHTSDEGVETGRCFTSETPVDERSSYCGVLQGNWGKSTVFK